MSENPYRAPTSCATKATDPSGVPSIAIGVRSGRREDLLRVIRLQRFAVVTLFFSTPTSFFYLILWTLDNVFDVFDDGLSHMIRSLPLALEYAIMSGMLLVIVSIGIASIVSLFLAFFLAARFYHVLIAMVIGLVSVYPGVGMITLLLLNSKARRVMRANGIPLGRLWAKGTME